MLTINSLQTTKSITPIANPSKQWIVKVGSIVYPIGISFIQRSTTKNDVIILSSKLASLDWYFTEINAHLVEIPWSDLLTNGPKVDPGQPVYIVLPQKINVDGIETIGFLVGNKDIRTIIDQSNNNQLSAQILPTTNFTQEKWDTIQFSATSSYGKFYTVSIWMDRTVSCDCPAWTINKYKNCKHVRHSSVIDAVNRIP